MASPEEVIVFWITCGCTLLLKLNRPHLWLINSFSLNWCEIGYLTSDLIPNVLMKNWTVSHRVESLILSDVQSAMIFIFYSQDSSCLWALVDARSMRTEFLSILWENSYELVSLFVCLLKLGFNLGVGLLEEIILNRCETLS